MARIAIVTYGSLGDLHPAIALGHALQRRGHDPIIAPSTPYREKILAARLRFHAVRPDLSLTDEALARRRLDGQPGTEFLMRDLVYPSIGDMYTDLVALTPDLDSFLASEHACAVPLVATKHGLPWAYCALSPISFL